MIAKVHVDMNEFLENTLDKPFTFSLLPTDGGGARSTVTIMSKYIPVEMQLLKRESITNTGTFRVDLLDGKGLPSADRNGKSDPYCVFELNGERVYKSEICKKTLAPVWNEKFEMHVPSREKAEFLVEVYDWDRVGEFFLLSLSPLFPARDTSKPEADDASSLRRHSGQTRSRADQHRRRY